MAHVALVTGAGSGMGQRAAWRLAAAGATVVAVDVDAEGLARTARRAPMVHPVTLDVSDADAVAALVARTEADHGGIDRLMNAAAVAPLGPVAELPAAELLRAMAINYGGVVAATTAVLPGMLARGRGEIVEFASLAGWLPSPKVGAYAATKAAVVSYSESLWRELRGTGVRLVCVCPPVVDTPMAERARDQLGKEFEAAPPIAPEQVLDAIETALAKGELWAFPGPLTATVWRLRRFAPEFLWRRLDAVAAR